jgi:UDPglucose 6-dehydrogenase
LKIVINGAGYVGLTTGTALAYLGHDVTCVDIDEAKIAMLKSGKSPIYEPGLEELIVLSNGHLKFSTDIGTALEDAEVVFIAVGTPPQADGKPNLSAVCAAATAVGRHIQGEFTVIVNKSTVPIGSGKWVDSIVREAYEEAHGEPANGKFSVASNPEFLREGTAIFDILYPDRVVVGSESPRARETLYSLYRPILEQTFPAPTFLPRPAGLGAVPLIATDLASAELIKYASNAFLSTKISFINEIGQLAEKVGADITHIAKGMGLDTRIGTRFLQAGLGWGGSCFGKDSSALVTTARDYGLRMPIVEAAREVNYAQRDMVIGKLLAELKVLKGATIGILGLAFKPHTDDLRDAPAFDIAAKLIERGARVKGHDPIALERAREEHGDLGMTFVDTAEAVFNGVDAVILATEWPEYRNLQWKRLGADHTGLVFMDGRNFFDAPTMEKYGFRYLSIGR